MALQAALRSANSRTPSLRTVRTKTITTKRLAAARVARSKTTMRVVGSRSSAEDPDALAARLAAQLAPEVAPTRSMAAVNTKAIEVMAAACSSSAASSMRKGRRSI